MDQLVPPCRAQLAAKIAALLEEADQLGEWLVGAHLTSALNELDGESGSWSIEAHHRALGLLLFGQDDQEGQVAGPPMPERGR